MSASSACVRVDTDAGRVMISVVPTGPASRAPVDVCAVVDVSGSMGVEATRKEGSGVEVCDGLSVLDVVKHALTTIAHVLGPRDRLSVVAYSSVAKVALALTRMDEGGKAKALEGIAELSADGQTNIWDGMKVGLDVLRAGPDADEPRVRACLLLTDGQPNVVPPSGHVAMLRRYTEEKSFSAAIHTFAFGYAADSALLSEIAEETGGLYAFIPDATLVGTVFISTLANLFTTLATDATLRVELSALSALSAPWEGPSGYEGHDGRSSLGRLGSLGSLGPRRRRTDDPRVIEVHLGALHQEQTRVVVLSCARPVRVVLRYTARGKITESTWSAESAESTESAESAESEEPNEPNEPKEPTESETAVRMRLEWARQSAASCIRTCVALGRGNRLSDARDELRALCVDPDIAASLRADLEGQVAEALSSTAHFSRWGQHYLPSLAAAHTYQVSNNCKDAGVLEYGGKVFRELRGNAEDVFCSLPPPVAGPLSYRMQPRQVPHGPQQMIASPASAAGPLDMSRYYDMSGSCFAGACLVAMHDGARTRVDEVRKGDKVLGGREVACVVRTDASAGLPGSLVKLGALLVTAWHPIRGPDAGWVFPIAVAGATVVPHDGAVYNFVLGGLDGPDGLDGVDGHEMTIEGVVCVTLGHGLDGPVVAHPYYGTERVVEDLRRMRGWDEGLVRLAGTVRSEAGCSAGGGLVCGLLAEEPDRVNPFFQD